MGNGLDGVERLNLPTLPSRFLQSFRLRHTWIEHIAVLGV